MNEAGFWASTVKKWLHAPLEGRKAWKIPAEIRAGLPDVQYSSIVGGHGWLELKYVEQWPVRETTPVEIAVTSEQLAHLREAAMVNEGAYVLVGVAGEAFLFHYAMLTPMRRMTRAQIERECVARDLRRSTGAAVRAILNVG